MIRVLVVDDSLTVRQRLIEILGTDPDFVVVGEAGDGRRAVELVSKLRPDVITLDIAMPDMTGLEATEQIMAHHPTPILVVSSSFNRGELFDTYGALSAGAVDVLDKPRPDDLEWERRFLASVRLVSKIKVITHPRGRLGSLGRTRDPSQRFGKLETATARGFDVVAIGASTGGPGALSAVLGAIGADFPLPVLVILHIDAQFAGAFAEWLGQQTRLPVRLARDGEPLAEAAGQVRLAPADVHLAVQARRIRLIASPPRNHCRPSVDVLFESLAAEPGLHIAACLLTGMGRDGAAGMLAIRRGGGYTIAQDEATSVIYGMPREAVLLGGVDRELPLPEIGPVLDSLRRDRS